MSSRLIIGPKKRVRVFYVTVEGKTAATVKDATSGFVFRQYAHQPMKRLAEQVNAFTDTVCGVWR